MRENDLDGLGLSLTLQGELGTRADLSTQRKLEDTKKRLHERAPPTLGAPDAADGDAFLGMERRGRRVVKDSRGGTYPRVRVAVSL